MPNTQITVSIRRLWALKLFMMLGLSLAFAIALWGLDIALATVPLLLVLTVAAIINTLIWWRLHPKRRVSEPVFFAQALLDVLLLFAFFLFSGGSTNPLIFLFLLPVIVVAVSLGEKYAWSMAALTALCYTLLMFYEMPLAHQHRHDGLGADFNLHVIGMWFGYMFSAGLIAFFVVKMSQELRRHEHALAQAREKALKDEQLVTLGALAVGAAHELGTPLGTMAIVAGELMREHNNDPALVEKMRILKQQVDRCKQTISQMLATVGQARPEAGRRIALDQYLAQVRADWAQMRPGVVLRYQQQGADPVPEILAEYSISQAIINVLNNAADASPEAVEMLASWDQEMLSLTISDRGPGLPAALTGHVGSPFFTTKAEGKGLGLFLSKTVLARFDATLILDNRAGGGVCAEIIVPLARLRA